MFGGIVITWIEVITVNRRDQLCIFMKREDFEDHELHCVQRWVRFIIEGSVTRVSKDSEEKDDMGDVAVGSDARKTPIHATTLEGINDLLDDGHEVDDDRLPANENKPIPTGNTDQPLYK